MGGAWEDDVSARTRTLTHTKETKKKAGKPVQLVGSLRLCGQVVVPGVTGHQPPGKTKELALTLVFLWGGGVGVRVGGEEGWGGALDFLFSWGKNGWDGNVVPFIVIRIWVYWVI